MKFRRQRLANIDRHGHEKPYGILCYIHLETKNDEEII